MGRLNAMLRSNTRQIMWEATKHLGPVGRENAQEAYEELVLDYESYPLSQFFTLTFGKRTSESAAGQKIREWHDALEWLHRSAVGLVYGFELTPSLHAHGVLIGSPNLCTRTAKALWHEIAGDAKVEAYDRDRQGVEYVLKEAYWTGAWFDDHLEYHNVHGKVRRSILTRQYFNWHQQVPPKGEVNPVCFSPVSRQIVNKSNQLTLISADDASI
jgi:hypothetical protein